MKNPSAAMEAHVNQLGIICLVILTGVVVFTGVVWYLITSGTFTPPTNLPPDLATLFNLLGLVAILKAYLLPRFRPPPQSGAGEGSLLAWHKINTLVAFALREGGAFLALVGVLLTGKLAGGFAVAGLAVVTMVLAWPRADQIQGGR